MHQARYEISNANQRARYKSEPVSLGSRDRRNSEFSPIVSENKGADIDNGDVHPRSLVSENVGLEIVDQVDGLAEDQDINVNSSDGNSLPLVSDNVDVKVKDQVGELAEDQADELAVAKIVGGEEDRPSPSPAKPPGAKPKSKPVNRGGGRRSSIKVQPSHCQRPGCTKALTDEEKERRLRRRDKLKEQKLASQANPDSEA
ncbi:hypothetical protein HWV62_33270 [Athelia sp. TMB]|nr:hypothetical protein HWV62_33270 [Athelia sp. TMB]